MASFVARLGWVSVQDTLEWFSARDDLKLRQLWDIDVYLTSHRFFKKKGEKVGQENWPC